MVYQFQSEKIDFVFFGFWPTVETPAQKLLQRKLKNIFSRGTKKPLCEDENLLLCAGRGGVLAGV